MKSPILSICIPTYNRSVFLKQSLDVLCHQINSDDVELIISDNDSPNDTKEVVGEFIKQNSRIQYFKQDTNVGASRNFISLMNRAQGKYILLLGDDDILTDNAVSVLVDILKGKDYGLLYVETRITDNKGTKEFDNKADFIKEISYFYTFMSSSIFRKDVVEMIEDPLRYVPSHLLQMPFYIKSTLLSDYNAITYEPVFATIGLAAKANGGYNFFDVFVNWYYRIWEEYLDDKQLLKWLKKDIWPFVWQYTKQLLIHKESGNFKVDNGWKILFKHYGTECYFWWSLIKYPFAETKRKIKKLL